MSRARACGVATEGRNHRLLLRLNTNLDALLIPNTVHVYCPLRPLKCTPSGRHAMMPFRHRPLHIPRESLYAACCAVCERERLSPYSGWVCANTPGATRPHDLRTPMASMPFFVQLLLLF